MNGNDARALGKFTQELRGQGYSPAEIQELVAVFKQNSGPNTSFSNTVLDEPSQNFPGRPMSPSPPSAPRDEVVATLQPEVPLNTPTMPDYSQPQQNAQNAQLQQNAQNSMLQQNAQRQGGGMHGPYTAGTSAMTGMFGSVPSSMDPELMKSVVGLGSLQGELEDNAHARTRAEGLKDTALPQMQAAGRMHVAANPMSFLATGLRRYKGHKDLKELQERRAGIRSEQTGTRASYLSDTLGQGSGGQPPRSGGYRGHEKLGEEWERRRNASTSA